MMVRPRHNPKPDENHNLVTELFERLGYVYRGYSLACLDISKRGGKRTDWIIAVGDVNVFIEIKTPAAYATKNHGLTRGETEFFATWPGKKAIIESYERLEDLMITIIDEIESR